MVSTVLVHDPEDFLVWHVIPVFIDLGDGPDEHGFLLDDDLVGGPLQFFGGLSGSCVPSNLDRVRILYPVETARASQNMKDAMS